MPERTLILLRHAKSDWSGGQADVDRPLAERGVRQAPRTGEWLAHSGYAIDLAVVSPAERARATWDLVAAEFDSAPPIHVDEAVYAASGGELKGVVRALPDTVHVVVLVGHNPGLEDLAGDLAGRPVPLPTSAVAVIGWEGPWLRAGRTPFALLAQGRPPQGEVPPP
ncbi:histidine phosphatase family protein [Cryobacterium sp. TMT3-29-2]|uniref:SixA phosphatase family protein n=1 Tax=Cryobacterium sp. TMT3-29-2 TaxID=2555867 RepID=UPI001073E772|nr:histidine phosphatase family protein [Cryobacterium sp. TMT3-29-2]TFC87843.1 histidine phosphatase family protein [Cryobacterium sp. TMT3-29-2]